MKINKKVFDSQFEIFFAEAQTINSETIKVLFNQKQGFLKNKQTGETIPKNIFATSEEHGKQMVIEAYCYPEKE